MALYDRHADFHADEQHLAPRVGLGDLFSMMMVAIILIAGLALLYAMRPANQVAMDMSNRGWSMLRPVDTTSSQPPRQSTANIPDEPRPTQAPIR
jgi:hypothetical protein